MFVLDDKELVNNFTGFIDRNLLKLQMSVVVDVKLSISVVL